MVQGPADDEVCEGGSEVGGGSVAGVTLDGAVHFFWSFGGDTAVTGREAGLFRREDGWDFEFAGFLFGFGEVVFGAESAAD